MAKCKPKRKFGWIKPVVAIIVIFGLLLWYYFGRIAPVVTTVSIESVRMRVSQAIDDMTDAELQGKDYDDFVITRYNTDGNLSILQVNSISVDLFARKVTSLIRNEMEEFKERGVAVPLGTLSGLPFLSGFGPAVEINLLNLGVVDADFSSEFISAGINQTLHRLYMRIVVNMTIVLPGYSMEFDNSSQVIICESVITGDVPLGNITVGGNVDLLP